MYTKLILCGTTLLALFVLHVQSTEHMGGGQGPIIIRSQGKRGRNGDLVMLGGQTKCGHGPTIIKTMGKRRYGNDLILLGGQNHCGKKKEVEVKHVPVPYAVKETVHVPVPYKETVHVPVHVPVQVPVHVPVPYKEEQSYGMEMGGYGDMGGMDMGGYGGGYARRR